MDWAATKDAYGGRPLSPDVQYIRLEYAAEIRALADWLVPDLEFLGGGDLQRMRWLERKTLRDIILDEADRAEAGD